jgi:predicted nucleotide-binding protein
MNPASSPPSYSRQTIFCAADMLKALGHSGFNRFLLELELPDPNVGLGSGLMARATSLADFVVKNPQWLTPERRTVAYEIVLRATQIWKEGIESNLAAGEREKFAAAMAREGLASNLEAQADTDVVRYQPFDTQAVAVAVRGGVQPSAGKEARPTQVFIVHGHDDGAREAVARFLERIGLEAIILQEHPDQGRTIIEKFESYASQVGFAVVLLTPDDLGGLAAASMQVSRARQNVIFELGYFVGKLGRGRACLLRKGDVEIPSDLYGVIYTDLDTAGGWKLKLAKELKAAGLKFDGEKLF